MGYSTRDRGVIPEDRRHDRYDIGLLREATSTRGGAFCCCKEAPVRVVIVSQIIMTSNEILAVPSQK